MRKKPPNVVDRLAALGPARAAVSVITAIELRTGADLARQPAKYHALLDLLLGELSVLPLDVAAVRAVARIRAHLRLVGKPIGELDCLIAGHALALGLVLVTHDTREFARVPDLRVEDWV